MTAQDAALRCARTIGPAGGLDTPPPLIGAGLVRVDCATLISKEKEKPR